MWQLRCVVTDKKLVEAMRALQGLTVEPVMPTEINPRHDLEKPAKDHGLTAREHLMLLIDNLKKNKTATVTAKQLAQHMGMGGFSRNSYSYGLRQLMEIKALKRTKTTGVYEVING